MLRENLDPMAHTPHPERTGPFCTSFAGNDTAGFTASSVSMHCGGFEETLYGPDQELAEVRPELHFPRAKSGQGVWERAGSLGV